MFDLKNRSPQYVIGAASASASSELNAFDRSLLAAGCGNYNLLKVSSILPPGAIETSEIDCPEGSLLAVAYADLVARPDMENGTQLSAAIAIAIPDDVTQPGVIMEHSDYGSEERVIEEVVKMATGSMKDRNIENFNIVSKSTSMLHISGQYSCVFAYVAIF